MNRRPELPSAQRMHIPSGISHHPEHIPIPGLVVGNERLEESLLRPHRRHSSPLVTSGTKVQVETCLAGLLRGQGHPLPAPTAAWQGEWEHLCRDTGSQRHRVLPAQGLLGRQMTGGEPTLTGAKSLLPGPGSGRECGHTPALSSGRATPRYPALALCWGYSSDGGYELFGFRTKIRWGWLIHPIVIYWESILCS